MHFNLLSSIASHYCFILVDKFVCSYSLKCRISILTECAEIELVSLLEFFVVLLNTERDDRVSQSSHY
ncbi:hypothetical protein BRARA_I02030 [Brassica rapa]|uniref:Uncharacterized protein n=1 Tax=Brassica campestris TaxID=3711 RepID=A0A397XXJ6_BRACM|nr:hypothetical protein BRARA_I02030 [Brassica rapa]